MFKTKYFLVAIFSFLVVGFTSCSDDSSESSSTISGYGIGEKRIIISDTVFIKEKLPFSLDGYYFDYGNEVNSSAVVSRYINTKESDASQIIFQSFNKLCSSEHTSTCSLGTTEEENNITTFTYTFSSDFISLKDKTNFVLNNFFDTNISLDSNASLPSLLTTATVSLNSDTRDYWLISLIEQNATSIYSANEKSLYRSYENMLADKDLGFIESLDKGEVSIFSDELLVGKTWGTLYENTQDSFSQCWSYDANGTGSLRRVVNTQEEMIPFYWSVESDVLTLKLTNEVNATSAFTSSTDDVHTQYFTMKDQNSTWQHYQTSTCRANLKDLGN